MLQADETLKRFLFTFCLTCARGEDQLKSSCNIINSTGATAAPNTTPYPTVASLSSTTTSWCTCILVTSWLFIQASQYSI